MSMLNDASVTIFGTDYSSQIRSVNGLPYGAEELDDTAMGDTTRSTDAGLNTWSLTIEAYAGEGSGEVNNDLFSQVGNTGTVSVKPTSAATSATNPDYTGTARLMNMNDLVGGTVGDQQLITLEFAAAGDLSRNTS